jgi:flagellar assembly protein FliH
LGNERYEALQKSREDGHEAGFAEGKAEVNRLIERMQLMLERAQDKRSEIIAEAEQEIIDLVLLIARKVVKVISENQRDIIISNVAEALRKVKGRGDVIIKVNMSDLKLSTEYKQEFIRLIESAKSVQIVEDSSVDCGGCIIETDFGEIDARIASQLAELESKILEISPIKSTASSSVPRQQNAVSEQIVFPAPVRNVISNPEPVISPAANAALTASAALAALATLNTVNSKGETTVT